MKKFDAVPSLKPLEISLGVLPADPSAKGYWLRRSGGKLRRPISLISPAFVDPWALLSW